MATTSPDNLYSPDSSDPYALTQDLGAMQDSVQSALVRRANAYVGTSAQRNAFTTAPVGTIWSDTNGSRLVYKRGASSWEPITPPVEDTGWVTVTSFQNGYSSSSGRPVRYRKVGSLVALTGQIERTPLMSGVSMFTLPLGFRPSQSSAFVAASSGTNVGKVDVQSGGNVHAAAVPSGGTYLMLENVRFFV